MLSHSDLIICLKSDFERCDVFRNRNEFVAFSYVNIKRPTCVVGQVYTKNTIGNNVLIGLGVNIVDDITIGNNVVIGASSVVKKYTL